MGKRIAVIGVGNIGRILLERLTTSGIPVADLLICDSEAVRAEEASRRFGPRACSLTEEPLPRSDIFLLTAPPKAVIEILKVLSTHLHPGQVVVSFAAAIPLSRLEALAPPEVIVVRVMPNAPSLVGKGINPVAYGAKVSPEVRALVEAVLQTLGETVKWGMSR
jgi:pyrroline-5-carboxylate reductase